MAEENLSAQQVQPIAPNANGATEGAPKDAIPADQTVKAGDAGIPKAPVDNGVNKPEEAKPVEQKTDEQKPEDKKEETPAEEYVTYNHAAADAAVGMLKEANVPPSEASAWFAKAAETGNLDDINADAIVEKLGAEKGALVISAVKDYYNREMASIKQQSDALLSQFGNKQNFEKVRDWANKLAGTDKAFAAKYQQYLKMIDIGTESAKIAARELKAAYESDSNNRSLDVKMVEGSEADLSKSSENLTRDQYLTKMKEADARGDTTEMARLRGIRAKALTR